MPKTIVLKGGDDGHLSMPTKNVPSPPPSSEESSSLDPHHPGATTSADSSPIGDTDTTGSNHEKKHSSPIGDTDTTGSNHEKKLQVAVAFAQVPILTASRPEFASYPLTDIQKPHGNDVLCGRGGWINNHPGNKNFRELVAAQKLPYYQTCKLKKVGIARQIVRAVRLQTPPGRFLRLEKKGDEKKGGWYDIGDEKAADKTLQALREGQPLMKRVFAGSGGGTRAEKEAEPSSGSIASRKKAKKDQSSEKKGRPGNVENANHSFQHFHMMEQRTMEQRQAMEQVRMMEHVKFMEHVKMMEYFQKMAGRLGAMGYHPAMAGYNAMGSRNTMNGSYTMGGPMFPLPRMPGASLAATPAANMDQMAQQHHYRTMARNTAIMAGKNVNIEEGGSNHVDLVDEEDEEDEEVSTKGRTDSTGR